MKRISDSDEYSLDLANEKLKQDIEQWLSKYGSQQMSFDDGAEADNYLRYDNFFDEFQKSVLSEIEKENLSSAVFDKYFTIIDLLSLELKGQINPFDKSSKYNDYFIKKLENIKERLKVFQTVPGKQIEPQNQNNNPINQIETKTAKLNTDLDKYGFFKLPMVKKLSDEGKGKLLELISSNELPYCIALFDYLGFIKHLDKEHFNTNYKRNKEISNWLNASEDSVKKNINVLDKGSEVMKRRYTSHIHKDTVKKDYQELK